MLLYGARISPMHNPVALNNIWHHHIKFLLPIKFVGKYMPVVPFKNSAPSKFEKLFFFSKQHLFFDSLIFLFKFIKLFSTCY